MGESLAAALTISGGHKVLSPTACGRSPLAEGARGAEATGKWGLLQLCQRGLGIVEDALELLEGGIHGSRSGQVNTGVTQLV